MSDTIFDKIVRREIPSYIVWEDDSYMAFLTPFPNTPGVTVVIPKTNPGDNAFHIDDEIYDGFMGACKKVVTVLEQALGVKRVALVVEGTGVPYVHAKLYPLYGGKAEHIDESLNRKEFHEEYQGYLTTVEGPQMSDERLKEIQAKILESQP